MTFFRCVCGGMLFLAMVAVNQAQGTVASPPPTLSFSERVAALVNRPSPWGPGSHAVLTFTSGAQLDLQVQFPLEMAGECLLGVRYVPRGYPPIFSQIELIRKSQPNIPPEAVAELLRLEHDERIIDCNSTLANVLRRGRSLAIPFVDPNAPYEKVYIDTPWHTLDLRLGPITLSMSFPAIVQHPVADWALQVEKEIRSYIDRGFTTP